MDYIKVESMWDLNNTYQPQCIRTGFETSSPIPENKFRIIKKAIEQAINNPDFEKILNENEVK